MSVNPITNPSPFSPPPSEPVTTETEANALAPEEKAVKKTAAKKKLHDGPGERPAYRHSFLALVRHYLPPSIHRPVIAWIRKIDRLGVVSGSEWNWLNEKPLPLKLLNRSLWKSSNSSPSYYVMLCVSGVIAALGLLAGSTAAIIGAMIVAPLMGPIVGMAFAITMGNRKLLRQAGFSVLTGALLTIFTAYLICSVLGISTLNEEILQRTQPTLIDLAIGLAAGLAGAFAKTRREVADALPGVAIAVALVPPLSVIGIGISLWSREVAFGATILFLTNLAGIIVSGGLVFIWQGYGSVRRARKGLTASTALICLLVVPLGFSMRELILEERARTSVSRLIREETVTFRDTNVRRLTVEYDGSIMHVGIDVAAPEGAISANQVNLVHTFLEKEIERPIDLDVNVFPVKNLPAQESENFSELRKKSVDNR